LRKNKSGDKQRYECLVCGKRFVKDLVFKGLKADGRAQGNITATIIWFTITTGATAGLSYYKEKE